MPKLNRSEEPQLKIQEEPPLINYFYLRTDFNKNLFKYG